MTTKSTTKQKTYATADKVRDGVTELRARSEAFDRQVRAFLGERPLLAVAGAVAAGFVAGRVLSRRA